MLETNIGPIGQLKKQINNPIHKTRRSYEITPWYLAFFEQLTVTPVIRKTPKVHYFVHYNPLVEST